jgi:hypothetical protein
LKSGPYTDLENECELVEMVQGSVQWQALMTKAVQLRVPENQASFEDLKGYLVKECLSSMV